MSTRKRFPVIYVRGYAMTKSEITETTSTPYMGLEYGSTKSRQAWNGAVRKVFFESPIVRLMKLGYKDIYQDGLQLETGKIAPESIVIRQLKGSASNYVHSINKATHDPHLLHDFILCFVRTLRAL